MNERYFIRVTWGPRQESLEVCTARAEALLRCMAHCDPTFTQWFDKGRSRGDALKRPITDAAALKKRFSQHRTDVGRKVTKELGFTLGIWNGEKDDESVSLLVSCGIYSTAVSNVCSLTLPAAGPARDRILCAPVLTEIIECMVDAWDPDDGLVGSHQYGDLRSDYAYGSPGIGWLIYISHRLGTVPPLLAPSTITRLGNKGSLITVTPDLFTASNHAHVEAADRVAAALKRAGLLKLE